MNQFMFVSDLDNTLVGDEEALKKLNRDLEGHRKEYGTKIIYATGRSLTLYNELTEEQSLLKPDALVTSVGTEIYLDTAKSEPDVEWSEKLSVGWKRELIVEIAEKFPELVLQKPSEQRRFKVSYLINEKAAIETLPQLKSELKNNGLEFNLIYSGGKDVDILPVNTNKGLAVKFLQQKWGFDSYTTVVCGDSGNDIALFSTGEERGIIVGNALPELLAWYKNNSTNYRYLAESFYAAGISEGLKHFKFM